MSRALEFQRSTIAVNRRAPRLVTVQRLEKEFPVGNAAKDRLLMIAVVHDVINRALELQPELANYDPEHSTKNRPLIVLRIVSIVGADVRRLKFKRFPA